MEAEELLGGEVAAEGQAGHKEDQAAEKREESEDCIPEEAYPCGDDTDPGDRRASYEEGEDSLDASWAVAGGKCSP